VRKRISIIAAFSAITLVLLTQYTNCAPVEGVSHLGVESSLLEVDGELRVVDNWNTKAILFADKKMNIESTQETVVFHGICLKSSEIKKIYWTIENEGGSEPHVFGEAVCERGSFTIEVVDAATLPCNINLVLIAYAEGSESFESVQVARLCN
jgi:hypothetical protein